MWETVRNELPWWLTVKNLPVTWDTRAQTLGWEDPLEEEMATYSSILAEKSHGQRSLVGYSSWGRERAGDDLTTKHQQQMAKEHVIWPQGKQAALIPALRDLYFGLSKDLQSEGRLTGKSSHAEVWGSHSGLYMV